MCELGEFGILDSQNVVQQRPGLMQRPESTETNEDRIKSIEDRLSRVEEYIRQQYYVQTGTKTTQPPLFALETLEKLNKLGPR